MIFSVARVARHAPLVFFLCGCPQNSPAGSVGSAASSAVVAARALELDEVANTPYYAAFENVPWPKAARYIRSNQVLWIEENQAGYAYITTLDAEGYANAKYKTLVPIGTDLAQMARIAQKATRSPMAATHSRYRQVTWAHAVASLRGEVSGVAITSVFDAHFDRVFLTTASGDRLLAIETPSDAMTKLRKEIDPEGKRLNYVLE